MKELFVTKLLHSPLHSLSEPNEKIKALHCVPAGGENRKHTDICFNLDIYRKVCVYVCVCVCVGVCVFGMGGLGEVMKQIKSNWKHSGYLVKWNVATDPTAGNRKQPPRLVIWFGWVLHNITQSLCCITPAFFSLMDPTLALFRFLYSFTVISIFLFSILNSPSLGGNLSTNGHLREIQVAVSVHMEG